MSKSIVCDDVRKEIRRSKQPIRKELKDQSVDTVDKYFGYSMRMTKQCRYNDPLLVLLPILLYINFISAFCFPCNQCERSCNVIEGLHDKHTIRGKNLDRVPFATRSTTTFLQSTTDSPNLVDFMDSIVTMLRKPNNMNEDKALQKNRRERKDLLLSLVQKASKDGSTKVLPLTEEIDQAIDSLAALSPITSIDELIKQLDRTWNLVWTTEKEINLFLDQGWSNSITQQISSSDSTIVNTIPFVNDNGYFGVTGRIFRTSDDPMIRTQFAFETATLQLKRVAWLPTLTFPPVGKGWFDTVYLDSNFRVDRNSRNDILICQSLE
jgi:PAP_fibrillin